MTKNIIIGVLVLVSILSFVYAGNQTSEAEKQAMMATKNLVLAEENAQKAKLQEQKAVEAAVMALIEQHKAEEAKAQLSDCLEK